MKFYLYSFLVGVVLGCGASGMTPEEKLALLIPDAKTTTPVSGQVLVDGQAVKDIWVYLIPQGEPFPKDAQPMCRGRTDEKGNFQISTYMENDGAPAGEYQICMEWLRFRQTGGQWIGPDKFGKRYADPAKSTFQVSVGADAVKIPPMMLSTQGIKKSR